MLTKNLRTHILELTKDREIPITQEQYIKLKNAQKLAWYNDTLEVFDADTKKLLHDGLWKDFAWFREIERSNLSGSNFVCDFWNRHTIHEDCKCSEKYNVSPIVFRTAVFSIYPNIKYPTQITPEIRNKVLASF